ncbi:hypothetical protein RhiirC2_693996, partial [Rhizophagus irregularis]
MKNEKELLKMLRKIMNENENEFMKLYYLNNKQKKQLKDHRKKTKLQKRKINGREQKKQMNQRLKLKRKKKNTKRKLISCQIVILRQRIFYYKRVLMIQLWIFN